MGFNPPQIDTNQRVLYRHQRALWPRGASHFSCFAKKSNQKKATPIFALVLRCSQRAGPAQIARWRANRAQWAHGAGLRPRVAPLLGVEYTGTPTGGFLIASRWRFTGTRMRASGFFGTNVEITGAAQLYRAASAWTVRLGVFAHDGMVFTFLEDHSVPVESLT